MNDINRILRHMATLKGCEHVGIVSALNAIYHVLQARPYDDLLDEDQNAGLTCQTLTQFFDEDCSEWTPEYHDPQGLMLAGWVIGCRPTRMRYPT